MHVYSWIGNKKQSIYFFSFSWMKFLEGWTPITWPMARPSTGKVYSQDYSPLHESQATGHEPGD